MQVGVIGLGRMGANMVRRLRRAGHDCVVYDVHVDAVPPLAREGATGAGSLADFVRALVRPRTVWIMALYERFSSRGQGEFAGRVLSALRFEFDGHQEKPGDDPAGPGAPRA